MSSVLGAISNIRTIIIGIVIIAVLVVVWNIANGLKSFTNPFENIFGGASNPNDGTRQDIQDSKEEIRNEIDQTEQSLKTIQVDLKGQLLDQVDRNRDHILSKEQDTAEQVKRVVEKENAEGEERLIDELDEIEARLNARLDNFETEQSTAQRFTMLADIYNRYVSQGSCSGESCSTREVESWEYEIMSDAFQSGIIRVDAHGNLINNLGVGA